MLCATALLSNPCGLAIISEWLKNDCKEDVDFIADLISRNTRANELN